MVSALLLLLVLFILSWLISAFIIYFASRLAGRRQGFVTAMTAALIGSIIYAAAFFFINSSFWAALIGGFAWLFALKTLYRVGWIRSAIIAVLIWLINFVAGFFLPLLF